MPLVCDLPLFKGSHRKKANWILWLFRIQFLSFLSSYLYIYGTYKRLYNNLQLSIFSVFQVHRNVTLNDNTAYVVPTVSFRWEYAMLLKSNGQLLFKVLFALFATLNIMSKARCVRGRIARHLHLNTWQLLIWPFAISIETNLPPRLLNRMGWRVGLGILLRCQWGGSIRLLEIWMAIAIEYDSLLLVFCVPENNKYYTMPFLLSTVPSLRVHVLHIFFRCMPLGILQWCGSFQTKGRTFFFFFIRIFCLRGGSTQFVHSQDAIAIR